MKVGCRQLIQIVLIRGLKLFDLIVNWLDRNFLFIARVIAADFFGEIRLTGIELVMMEGLRLHLS